MVSGGVAARRAALALDHDDDDETAKVGCKRAHFSRVAARVQTTGGGDAMSSSVAWLRA